MTALSSTCSWVFVLHIIHSCGRSEKCQNDFVPLSQTFRLSYVYDKGDKVIPLHNLIWSYTQVHLSFLCPPLQKLLSTHEWWTTLFSVRIDECNPPSLPPSNRVFTEGTCKLLKLVISDLVDEDFVVNRRQQAASALLFGMVALLTKPGQTFAPLIGTWLLCVYTGTDRNTGSSMRM